MALTVVWSEEAEEQLDEIIDYLSQNWTDKEISNFFQRLEERLGQIMVAPHRYKNSERRKNTKEFQLSSHITIFYSYNKLAVNILLLWVNKKDPINLK